MGRAYDPGQETPARPVEGGRYLIPSFRGADADYLVDVLAGTCSCPHWQERLAGTGTDCKHLAAVRQQADWLARVETARTLSEANLARLLAKYGGDPVVGGALRFVRDERRWVR